MTSDLKLELAASNLESELATSDPKLELATSDLESEPTSLKSEPTNLEFEPTAGKSASSDEEPVSITSHHLAPINLYLLPLALSSLKLQSTSSLRICWAEALCLLHTD